MTTFVSSCNYHIKYVTAMVLAVTYFSSLNSFALDIDTVQLPMDRIFDQNRSQERQQKLFEKPVKKEKALISKESKRTGDYCLEIKEIEFRGATKLSKKVKKNILNKVLDKCIYNDQIGVLLNEVTNFYIDSGYSNARIYIKDYDAKAKVLILSIFEGIIDSIILNNIKQKDRQDNGREVDQISQNSFSDKAQLFFAFPTKSGNIFNIDDMEQGVAQMNRLRSNNATIQSRPAQKEGGSEIIINNYKNPNSLEMGVTYDNSGSKSTGVYSATYNINKDNLFKINDNISFSQIKSDRSETDMFTISIPFGYYLLDYTDSSNKYSLLANGARITGTSTSHNLGLSRLLFKDQKHEINLKTSLNFRNQTRKVEDVIDIDSQRVSIGKVGFDYSLKLKNNLNIYAGLTYSKGLKIHGAIDDKKDYDSSLSKESPRAQFEKFNYNLNLYKAFAKYFSYNLQANIQHSSDALYSSQAIYVGGSRYSVRGLQSSGISGSDGGYFRNDINIDLGRIIGNLERNKNEGNIDDKMSDSKFTTFLANRTRYLLKRTRPYVFYDYGYAREIVSSITDAKTDYIAGAGLGFKYYGKYFNSEISYAKSLRNPSDIMIDNDYQNSAIYFGISGRYWVW